MSKRFGKVGFVAAVVVGALSLGLAVDAVASEGAPTEVRAPAVRGGAHHDIFDIFSMSPEQFVNAMGGAE